MNPPKGNDEVVLTTKIRVRCEKETAFRLAKGGLGSAAFTSYSRVLQGTVRFY